MSSNGRSNCRVSPLIGKGRTYFDLGVLGGARLLGVRSEMGTGSVGGALSTILTALSELKPAVVIMLGIAFGIDAKKQPIGQVLVSKQIQPYELQRVGKTVELRGDQATASPKLLSRFRAAAHGWRYGSDKVTFGLLLSGEKLIDNEDYRDQLLNLKPEAVGGEMEAAGLYAAAQEFNTPWIVVKAVCDWADGSKSYNKKSRQKRAATRAVDFVLYAIHLGGFAEVRAAEAPHYGSDESEGSTLPGRPINMPNLPPYYLPREKEFSEVKSRLLRGQVEKVAIIGRIPATHVGLQGMGGIGKTVLANALGYDSDLLKRFRDGVIWMSLGRRVDLARKQMELAGYIGEDIDEGTDSEERLLYLKKIFAEKNILAVLDDVWYPEQIGAFDVFNDESSILITTRDAGLVYSSGAYLVSLDFLSKEDALLLISEVSQIDLDELPEIANEVVKECGFLPLAIAMAGSMLRGKSIERWREILHDLRNAELSKISTDHISYEYETLFRAFQVSVDSLNESLRVRYFYFSVFPENVHIPRGFVERMWSLDGDKDEDIENGLDSLVSRSLIFEDRVGNLRLHDLQRDYLYGLERDSLRKHEQFLLETLQADRGQAQPSLLSLLWSIHYDIDRYSLSTRYAAKECIDSIHTQHGQPLNQVQLTLEEAQPFIAFIGGDSLKVKKQVFKDNYLLLSNPSIEIVLETIISVNRNKSSKLAKKFTLLLDLIRNIKNLGIDAAFNVARNYDESDLYYERPIEPEDTPDDNYSNSLDSGVPEPYEDFLRILSPALSSIEDLDPGKLIDFIERNREALLNEKTMEQAGQIATDRDNDFLSLAVNILKIYLEKGRQQTSELLNNAWKLGRVQRSDPKGEIMEVLQELYRHSGDIEGEVSLLEKHKPLLFLPITAELIQLQADASRLRGDFRSAAIFEILQIKVSNAKTMGVRNAIDRFQETKVVLQEFGDVLVAASGDDVGDKLLEFTRGHLFLWSREERVPILVLSKEEARAGGAGEEVLKFFDVIISLMENTGSDNASNDGPTSTQP